jgi:hypothetical protein
MVIEVKLELLPLVYVDSGLFEYAQEEFPTYVSTVRVRQAQAHVSPGH